MKLTWLGHAGYRMDVGGAHLLLDPWLRGNPAFDEKRFDEAIEGATHILVTHGHFDHAPDVVEIAGKTGAVVAGIVEYATWVGQQEGVDQVMAFNMGGTVDCNGVAVTMVRASHSSSFVVDGQPVYSGTEASFMLETGGRTLYFMGDTDVHADMEIFQDLHAPDYAIVPIGGNFTMDAKRAAYACQKFFKFKAVIPYHYGTFPVLAQSADEFAAKMKGTRIVVPEVMVPFEL